MKTVLRTDTGDGFIVLYVRKNKIETEENDENQRKSKKIKDVHIVNEKTQKRLLTTNKGV